MQMLIIPLTFIVWKASADSNNECGIQFYKQFK